MSQKVQVLFVDDLDEGPADETVRFGLDGTPYEIDLSTRHADELRDALKNYIQHARKVGSAPRRPTRKPSSVDTVAVRAWAHENGIDIKERGRVPAEVIARYQAATGK